MRKDDRSMKKLSAVTTVWVLAAILLAGGCSTTQTTAPTPQSTAAPQGAVLAPEPVAFERGDLTVITAKVEALDLKKRLVTVRGPKGDRVTLKVHEAAKNLPQVKVGDTVKLEYLESVAVRVLAPGEKAAPASETAALVTARPGEKPAALAAEQITVTASIMVIDKTKPSVTLKGPEGNVVEVRVRHPEVLEKVKTGDNIEITYTEALALAVERIAY